VATRTFDVVGLGENSVDLVLRLPGAPVPDGKIGISARRVRCGGQVATTMATCARFGLRVAYVGAFGSDDSGALVRRALDAAGVDTSAAQVRECPNRYAVILVDERTGSRTVLWQRDRRLALAPDDVPRELIGRARLVHVDDRDVEASVAAARIAREVGTPVTSDIEQVTSRTAALVAAVDVPIYSAHAVTGLSGRADVGEALRALHQSHHLFSCATGGARGAHLFDGERLHIAPAFPVEVRDTTGAGDVFRGACIVALLRGDAPAELLRFASAAAAASCTKEGAIDAVPSSDEVERLLIRQRPS
jgi:sugar/nucleoside kinase (ribokinase family)